MYCMATSVNTPSLGYSRHPVPHVNVIIRVHCIIMNVMLNILSPLTKREKSGSHKFESQLRQWLCNFSYSNQFGSVLPTLMSLIVYSPVYGLA
jgi:hypothetical protein